MTQYMLLFSLGPVQPFIAQARKTRDLWLGSFLLSALMEVSMEGIDPTKLIFPVNPFIDRRNKIPDLPNKYIAVFDKQQDAIDTAIESKKNIKSFWKIICDEVWVEVIAKTVGFSQTLLEQWNNQVEPAHLFEIFYVVVEGDSAEYRAWLKETQLVFDGRKHLRDFQAQDEEGEKSTISGLRAALRGPGQRRSDVQDFWKQVAKGRSQRDIDQDGSERLDAIDTVKRFVFLSKRFREKFNISDHNDGLGYPSTSSVAVASFLERLILASQNNGAQLSNVINDWVQTSSKLNDDMRETIPFLSRIAARHKQSPDILTLDGDCLFSETFHPQRLKKEFGFDDTRAEERMALASNGPKALSRLFTETDKLSFLRPIPYYAMIQMDGDKMGVLINGVQGQEEHQAINRVMSDFARTYAPDIVEDKYPGRLVYAGGDDVFALAPLTRDLPVQDGEARQIRTVLELVDQLQQRYCDVVRSEVIDHDVQSTEPNKKTRKELVTASIGIAIAHHYTSLSYVRRVSKEAEQLAKNHYGRDALVVTVLRRSGEQTRVGCHWQYPGLEADGQPIPLFLAFYKLFKNDVLSPKCVYNLLEEAPTLVGLDQEDKENNKVAQQSEVKRVLRRQRNPAKEKELLDSQLQDLARRLVKLAQAMDRDKYPSFDKEQACDKARAWSAELHSDSNYRRYGLVEVLGWLLVMLFLARKEQE